MGSYLEELRKINFHDLITLSIPDIGMYTFNEFRQNGYEHPPITGYCISCEEKGIHQSSDDPNYKLTNISHGTHASDFLSALKNPVDVTQWHQEPVMFIYEAPSLDYGIYKEVAHAGYRKHPSKEWYWIHGEQGHVSYPERFCGGEYGGFVLSAILTFRLADVYTTNLVKCGLNDEEGGFEGIGSYKDECVQNCYKRFLLREIDLLKPVIIFAVGSAVEGWVKHFVQDSCFIQQLPHPAGRRRGFRDEHYKVLYFWLVLRALYKSGIVGMDECEKFTELFLKY